MDDKDPREKEEKNEGDEEGDEGDEESPIGLPGKGYGSETDGVEG